MKQNHEPSTVWRRLNEARLILSLRSKLTGYCSIPRIQNASLAIGLCHDDCRPGETEYRWLDLTLEVLLQCALIFPGFVTIEYEQCATIPDGQGTGLAIHGCGGGWRQS